MTIEATADWMTGRQNPVPERGSEELNADLQAIVDAFGEGWLKLDGPNPVQGLWARQDFQATTELLTLGDALRHLTPAFPSAVRSAIKKIKSDPGERKGFMLELLVLRFFQAAGHDVRPTGRGAPGFDLSLTRAGVPLDISLKNFTRSKHERTARGHWRIFKTAYLKARQSDSQAASGLFVQADRYPTPEEWGTLTKAVAGIASLPLDGLPHTGPAPFTLTKHGLPNVGTFHDRQLSYQLITLVPHHRNEHPNLLDSLEKAAANAVKHAKVGRCAALMVRLRENADLDRYKLWAQNYLARPTEKVLELIIFYQPAWVRDAENVTFLHHGVAIAASDTYRSTFGGGTTPLVVPIGKTGGSSNSILLVGRQQISVGHSYLMQEGRYHLRYGNEGTLTSFAPYVETVAYLQVGSEEIAMNAIRPTTQDFELLD